MDPIEGYRGTGKGPSYFCGMLLFNATIAGASAATVAGAEKLAKFAVGSKAAQAAKIKVDKLLTDSKRWQNLKEAITQKVEGIFKKRTKFFEKVDGASEATLDKLLQEVESMKKLVATNIILLKRQPSWLPNRLIIGDLDNPKGLIGTFEKTLPSGELISDIKDVIEEVDPPLTNSTNYKSASKGGFKILHVDASPINFWEQYNKPWLDDLVAKKADIIVLSDKDNISLIRKNGIPTGEKTTFGKEIEYMENLVQQGIYRWDEAIGTYKSIIN